MNKNTCKFCVFEHKNDYMNVSENNKFKYVKKKKQEKKKNLSWIYMTKMTVCPFNIARNIPRDSSIRLETLWKQLQSWKKYSSTKEITADWKKSHAPCVKHYSCAKWVTAS